MSGRPFRFALNPVLMLRDRAVEAAQRALAEAMAQRVAAEEALSRAHAPAPTATVGTTIRGLHAAAHHRACISRTRADSQRALDHARAIEADRRRALAEAVRQREALAALHDRARELHRADGQRAEAALLDDLALASHHSRS